MFGCWVLWGFSYWSFCLGCLIDVVWCNLLLCGMCVLNFAVCFLLICDFRFVVGWFGFMVLSLEFVVNVYFGVVCR